MEEDTTVGSGFTMCISKLSLLLSNVFSDFDNSRKLEAIVSIGKATYTPLSLDSSSTIPVEKFLSVIWVAYGFETSCIRFANAAE